MAIPLIVVSHTVAIDAEMRWHNGTSNVDLDGANVIPAGTYWFDPNCATTDTTNLIVKLEALLTAADGAGTYSAICQNIGSDIKDGVQLRIDVTGGPGTIQARLDEDPSASAAAADEGRLVGRRLGINQLDDDPGTPPFTATYRILQGVWSADRGESVDIDGTQQGHAVVQRTFDDSTFRFSLGDSHDNKMLRLFGTPKALARRRDTVPDVSANYDRSFETNVWPWLVKGERMRFYQDRDNRMQLASSMNATTTTATVSATSASNDDVICVDGEYMRVLSGGGTTSLTVFRHDPKSHVTGAPIGINSFAATFALAADGGNISLAEFAPRRRGASDDRWDLEIPLIQTRS